MEKLRIPSLIYAIVIVIVVVINIETQPGISNPLEASNSPETQTNVDETTTIPTRSANESKDLQQEKEEHPNHEQIKNGTVSTVDKGKRNFRSSSSC